MLARMCREPIWILSICEGHQTSGPAKCHLSAVAIYMTFYEVID